jgi:hypothetical protein
MPAPSYPRGMNRPTHRIRIWTGAGSRPVTLPVYLDGDVLREDVTGDALVTRDADDRWHWTGVDRTVTAIEVLGLPGRPASPGSRTEEIHLRLGKRRTMLRVTSEQLEAYRAAAPDGEVGEWFRALLAAHPKPRRAVLATHLRTIGDRAASQKP